MKTAICDDNTTDCSLIYTAITTNSIINSSDIVMYNSGNALLSDIKQNVTYDIIFLDVEMPEIDGITLGKLIKTLSPNSCIVFITNYPQYAIEAFDCEATGYLLKPLDDNKTKETLYRVIEKYKKFLQKQNNYHIIKMHNRKERILIKDIYWIKCEKKHVIYMLKNTSYDTVGTLSDAYKALKDYGFYQVHQGYIVNMDKIKKFESYYALLDNGAKVEISVRKRRDFLMAYAKYIEENA